MGRVWLQQQAMGCIETRNAAARVAVMAATKSIDPNGRATGVQDFYA
jgi:hypothetical protein